MYPDFRHPPTQPLPPAFCHEPYPPQVEAWMAQLDPRQRIAQLLHVPSWSHRDETHAQAVLHLIETYGIGGVIFFQGDPQAQVRYTRRYQSASKVPLLISIDAEWGLAMRLADSPVFPYAMTLGAVQDLSLIYEMGLDLARQCRRLGIHINFAPTVDINTEPDNPVIGFRSFGSDPDEVAARGRAYMQGLQDGGVLAVAKHFPGHGDTATDSHHSLPVLPHDHARLEAVELHPFRTLSGPGWGASCRDTCAYRPTTTDHTRVPRRPGP
ncbi:MAG: hypothetical protein OHK0039_44850 [Bacteroidia bacterium]